MIQAVIFDWAGTTVDYGCFAPVQAFQEAFAHHGVPVTLEETRKPMGMLKRDHIRTMLRMERIARAWEETHGRPAGEEDVEAVYAQFEPKLFSILDRFSTPKPFAVETAGTFDMDSELKIWISGQGVLQKTFSKGSNIVKVQQSLAKYVLG